MSFVWGAGIVAFLRQRFKEMSAHHCYHGMEYSEDRSKIATWAPLIMDGRDDKEPFAATRMITGSECFGKELATGGWLDRLKTIIPTYGIDLKQDAVATRNTRAKTAAVLGLQNI
jgi:hypothetical protein